MHRAVLVGLLVSSSFALGCKDPTSGGTDTDAASTTAASTTSLTSITTVTPTTEQPSSTSAEASTTQADGSATAGETLATTGPATTEPVTTTDTGDLTTGGGVCVPLECDGKFYACGDCMDNDGDGKFDTGDPECISPCDDREDSFATGLSGDNMDPCKQDCFFDGNSGGGKDCEWNLACDPENPGGDKCPYDPEETNCPDMQSEECVTLCQAPNGCDCFGCCTVSVDGMSYDIFIGDEDCMLSDISSCSECTKNDDCGDDCVPEDCEVCFGMELPPECDESKCPDGVESCKVDDMGGSNCPVDQFCNTGCCVPIQPG
jgi:hypothetical protein